MTLRRSRYKRGSRFDAGLSIRSVTAQCPPPQSRSPRAPPRDYFRTGYLPVRLAVRVSGRTSCASQFPAGLASLASILRTLAGPSRQVVLGEPSDLEQSMSM